jgi:hypothetical protein
MQKICAYVNKITYLVENMVVWDGVSPLIAPDGFEYVETPSESVQGDWSLLGIGWTYINGEFIEPPNPTPPPQVIGGAPYVIA